MGVRYRYCLVRRLKIIACFLGKAPATGVLEQLAAVYFVLGTITLHYTSFVLYTSINAKKHEQNANETRNKYAKLLFFS